MGTEEALNKSIHRNNEYIAARKKV